MGCPAAQKTDEASAGTIGLWIPSDDAHAEAVRLALQTHLVGANIQAGQCPEWTGHKKPLVGMADTWLRIVSLPMGQHRKRQSLAGFDLRDNQPVKKLDANFVVVINADKVTANSTRRSGGATIYDKIAVDVARHFFRTKG